MWSKLFESLFSSFSGSSKGMGEMGKSDWFDMAVQKGTEGGGGGGGSGIGTSSANAPVMGPMAPMSNPFIDSLKQAPQSSQNDQSAWQDVLNFFLANQGGK